jgi:ribosomal protein S13
MLDVATDLTMPVETTQQIIWALAQLSGIGKDPSNVCGDAGIWIRVHQVEPETGATA